MSHRNHRRTGDRPEPRRESRPSNGQSEMGARGCQGMPPDDSRQWMMARRNGKRLSERYADPIRRALDGDEALPPIVSRLWDEFVVLFPDWRI